MKRAIRPFAVLLAFAAACVSPPAVAQEREGNGQGISAYAVARLKVLDGSVWVRTEADGEWEEFETNSPVPPGSRISVPASSEGELQFHGGQFLLLTPGTDLEVRELREERSLFRIRSGEIRFDLTTDDFAPVAVRVPGGARVHVPRPGKYWIIVDEGNRTRLVVRSGEASVVKDEGKVLVRGGEQAVIGETVTVGSHGQAEPQPPPPEPAEPGTGAPVPPSVTYELREYGEWVTVPEYGYVWRPYVSAGWTPYVYGRWVWIHPYGWTWVSNEPWGWYPYRCGYWVVVPTFGWVWYPYNAFFSVSVGVGYGPAWRPYSGYGGYPYYYRRAYYYPANVRFVPEGRQVRWVPLKPGERYRPAGVRRGDASLSGWNRPLESGRVFVRGAPGAPQARDYTSVRAEQQARTRQALEQRTRKDARPVRPERIREGRPSGYRAPPRQEPGAGKRPEGRYDAAPPPADGKGRKPSGGGYVPKDTAPERGRPVKEGKEGKPGKPAATAPVSPPPSGKPAATAPVSPPPSGKPAGETRGTVPREKGPAAPPPSQPRVRESAPPPSSPPRYEAPAEAPEVPRGGRGGDGGGRSSESGGRGDGGGRGGDDGSRGGGGGRSR